MIKLKTIFLSLGIITVFTCSVILGLFFNTDKVLGENSQSSYSPLFISGNYIIPKNSAGVIGSSTVDAVFRTSTSTSICLVGDTCRTTWPAGDGLGTSTNPFMASYYIATSTTATSTFAGSLGVSNYMYVGPYLYDGAYPNFDGMFSSDFIIADFVKDTPNYVSVNLVNPNHSSDTEIGLKFGADLSNDNDGDGNWSYTGLIGLTSSIYNRPEFGLQNVQNMLSVTNTGGPVSIASATSSSESYIQFLISGYNAEAARITNTGAFGIGSTSPTARLTVTNPLSTWSLVVEDQANDPSPFVIDASGNVGIGTAAPTNALDVTGVGSFSSRILANTLRTYNATGVTIQDTNTGAGTANIQRVIIGDSTNTVGITGGSYVGLSVLANYNEPSGAANNTDLLINRTETTLSTGYQRLIDARVGGVSKFVLTNTGNLGIGTTSPLSKLSVAGNGYFDGSLTASNITATGTVTVNTLISQQVQGIDGEVLFTIQNGDGGLFFGTSGGLELDSGSFNMHGDVGGTISADSSTLTLNALYDKITLDSPIAFLTGNLGIGTSSPYAKLSVVGQAVARNFVATSTIASSFINASTTNLSVNGFQTLYSTLSPNRPVLKIYMPTDTAVSNTMGIDFMASTTSAGYTIPFRIYTAPTRAGSTLNSAYLDAGTGGGQYLYFGSSGHEFYSLDFQYVSYFTNLPSSMMQKGAASALGSCPGRNCAILGNSSYAGDLTLSAGASGWLTPEQDYAGRLGNGSTNAFRFNSYQADKTYLAAGTGYPYGFIFNMATSTAALTLSPNHTLWSVYEVTKMALSNYGFLGIGSSTPWGFLSIATSSTLNLNPLMAVSTTTGNIVYKMDNQGVITEKNELYSQQFAYETMFGNASTTATTPDVYYPIRGWATTTPSYMPLNTGSAYFTLDAYNGSTTVAVAGVYKAALSASIHASNVSEIHVDIFVNGVEQKQCAFRVKVATPTDASSGSAECFIKVPANGIVDSYVRSDAANNSITWTHLNRSINKISNY